MWRCGQCCWPCFSWASLGWNRRGRRVRGWGWRWRRRLPCCQRRAAADGGDPLLPSYGSRTGLRAPRRRGKRAPRPSATYLPYPASTAKGVGAEGVGRCRRCRLFSAVGCCGRDLPRCSHFLRRPHHPAATAAAPAAEAEAAPAAATAAATTVAGVLPPPPPKTRSSHRQWPPPVTTRREAWAVAGACPRAR